jgi:hypothetical protein
MRPRRKGLSPRGATRIKRGVQIRRYSGTLQCDANATFGEANMDIRRQRGRDWTEADDQRLRELALAGCSAQQIAMDLNRNVPSVRYRCDKFGLAIRQITVRNRSG